MKIAITDLNNANSAIASSFNDEWRDIDQVLQSLPLHLKESDQAGKQGSPIFDPVGTNEYLKLALADRGWSTNIPIPNEYKFLGTDVDFGRDGVIAEVQFSNYPFLLNNLLRSELFFKAKVELDSTPVQLAIIITKAHMFPASNSTLYYEQARKQLSALADKAVFDVPMRLVGLFEETGEVPVKWTSYHARRYSRTVVNRRDAKCRISPAVRVGSRAKLEILK